MMRTMYPNAIDPTSNLNNLDKPYIVLVVLAIFSCAAAIGISFGQASKGNISMQQASMISIASALLCLASLYCFARKTYNEVPDKNPSTWCNKIHLNDNSNDNSKDHTI